PVANTSTSRFILKACLARSQLRLKSLPAMVPDVTGEAAEAARRLATRLELRQRASGASLGGYRPRGPHGQCWDEAAKACGVDLTWYQATQHSFVSRALRDGVLGSGRHRDGGGSSRQLTPLLILAILGGSPSIQIAPFPSIAPWSRQNNRPMRWIAT